MTSSKNKKERAALKKLMPEILKEYKWVKKFFIASANRGDSIDQIHDALVTFLLDKFEKEDFATFESDGQD